MSRSRYRFSHTLKAWNACKWGHVTSWGHRRWKVKFVSQSICTNWHIGGKESLKIGKCVVQIFWSKCFNWCLTGTTWERKRKSRSGDYVKVMVSNFTHTLKVPLNEVEWNVISLSHVRWERVWYQKYVKHEINGSCEIWRSSLCHSHGLLAYVLSQTKKQTNKFHREGRRRKECQVQWSAIHTWK